MMLCCTDYLIDTVKEWINNHLEKLTPKLWFDLFWTDQATRAQGLWMFLGTAPGKTAAQVKPCTS